MELDPLTVAQLKKTGECFVSFLVALFDLDYPRHYFRRIKNASLIVPYVTGPYLGVNILLQCEYPEINAQITSTGPSTPPHRLLSECINNIK